MDAPVIELGPKPVTLVRCTMLQTIALHIDKDGPEADDTAVLLAVGAAAMRLCWPEGAAWPVTRRPRPWTLGTPILKYGAAAFADLAELDVPLKELALQLRRARMWAASCTMREADVKAAEDFSAASEAPATSEA